MNYNKELSKCVNQYKLMQVFDLGLTFMIFLLCSRSVILISLFLNNSVVFFYRLNLKQSFQSCIIFWKHGYFMSGFCSMSSRMVLSAQYSSLKTKAVDTLTLSKYKKNNIYQLQVRAHVHIQQSCCFMFKLLFEGLRHVPSLYEFMAVFCIFCFK